MDRLTVALALWLSGCTGGDNSADGVWQAVLVNGGGEPASNYASHMTHLEGVYAALQGRGVPPSAVQVLASDGPGPDADLTVLTGQATESPSLAAALSAGPWGPGRSETLVSTTWPHGDWRAATPSTWSAALDAAVAQTGADERLFVYTTDHGEPDGALSLWHSRLLPTDAVAPLRELPPGARALVAMSQCYSGAHATALLELRDSDNVDVCGIFSVPADREASGCTPDLATAPVGHGSRLVDVLPAAPSLEAAHRWLLLADRTPDVPVRTSDVWAWDALVSFAGAQDPRVVADSLLATADPSDPVVAAAWSDIDALALRTGLPAVRSLAALDAALAALDPALSHTGVALDSRAATWDALVAHVQDHDGRVPPTLERRASALLRQLEVDNQRWEALLLQEATLARMSWLLVRAAARSLPEPGGIDAMDGILACEATPLPGPKHPLPAQPPWPSPPSGSVEKLPWLGLAVVDLAPDSIMVVAKHPDSPSPVPARTALTLDGGSLGLSLSLHTGAPLLPELGTPIPRPDILTPSLPPAPGAVLPPLLSWLGQAPPPGAHTLVWVGPDCPLCAGAVAQARALSLGPVVVIDDRGSGSLGLADPGGWTGDAVGLAVVPTIVHVDAQGRLVWRVDGWDPEAGVDVPTAAAPDDPRFPRD